MSNKFYIMSPYVRGRRCRFIRGTLLCNGKKIVTSQQIVDELNRISYISISNLSNVEDMVFDGLLVKNRFIIFDIIPYKNFMNKNYKKKYKDRVNDLAKISLGIELLHLTHIEVICWTYFGDSVVELLNSYQNIHTDMVLNLNTEYFHNKFFVLKQNPKKYPKGQAFK